LATSSNTTLQMPARASVRARPFFALRCRHLLVAYFETLRQLAKLAK
jgi:hypothetical protein